MQNGVVFTRSIKPPINKSFFLFGPRGTGKSSWLKVAFPDALIVDLLRSEDYARLLANPSRLEEMIPPSFDRWVVLDEVQRVPALLNEVHRLIEQRKLRFALTGSSARKLRRGDVNLLAGRALRLEMHPLTAVELGTAFDLRHSLSYGQLPSAYVDEDPAAYLRTYVQTYLREEVQAEGLTRNLPAFARCLEALSLSQGNVLSISSLARDVGVDRKLAQSYVEIMEDLLIGLRVPAFNKRAKRRIVQHPKFYFFDPGVYNAIRPRGPLDAATELLGPAAETLVLSELRAHNSYGSLEYGIYYWRTSSGAEVDFVLYGPHGLIAIEVKSGERLRDNDFAGLEAFRADYPMARCFVFHGGTSRSVRGDIQTEPLTSALQRLPEILRA